MNNLQTIALIFGIIALIIAIITLLYTTSAQRRKSIVLKKLDYLVEDITYKSEMLNPTVETITKMSNYVDVFELVARKNMKIAARVAAKNKDDIYAIANRIKKAMMPKDSKDSNSKGGDK